MVLSAGTYNLLDVVMRFRSEDILFWIEQLTFLKFKFAIMLVILFSNLAISGTRGDKDHWGKKELTKLFDVTMGSCDGAETCELVLVDSFLLHQII